MEYQSILKSAEVTYIIEKSKFIAHVKPVKNEVEAIEFIEAIKKKHWNASHNVPVYLIGEKMEFQKFSDDGEPSGTAGVPIYNMLKNEGITNIVMVVTRDFGGIKLGKGGLVRAYTHSAQLGLEAAEIIKYQQCVQFKITYDYTFHGKIENYILQTEKIYEMKTVFESQVEKEIAIPIEDEQLMEHFIELTGNQIQVAQLETQYYCIKDSKVIGG